MDLQATIEAIAILNTARKALAEEPSLAVWCIVKHAQDRLDAEVHAHLTGSRE